MKNGWTEEIERLRKENESLKIDYEVRGEELYEARQQRDALRKVCGAAFGVSCERSQTRRKWTVKDQLIHDQLKKAVTP